MAAEVAVWWIGAEAVDEHLIEEVRVHIEGVFRLTARRYTSPDRPTGTFDVRRGQHSSTQLLRWLVERGQPAGRVMAVTDADLFIPVLTFVYGEAQLGGRIAIVSTARLGMDVEVLTNPGIRVARAVKEAVHELGHTFGLLHCDSRACVMSRSTSVLDVDSKRVALCRGCEALYAELRRKEGHHG